MKKQISYKIVSLVFSVLVVCFAITFYAVGWDEPSAPPPGGNVPAPLNTGNITQYKSGALGIGGLFETDNETHLAVLGGNVGIGTVAPSEKLDVVGSIVASGTVCDSTGCIGEYGDFGAWTNQDILGNTIQGNLGGLNTNQYQAAGDGFLVVRKHSGVYPRINIFVKLAGLGSFIELYDARQNTGGVSDQSATIPIGKDDIFYVNTDRVDGDFQIYWKPIGNFQLVKQGVSFPTAYVNIAMWRKRAFITSDTATARVTVTQDIAAGLPLAGVTVHGTWSGDYRATISGVTNVNGQVLFGTDWIARTRHVTFTVNRITIGGHEFILDGVLSVTR